MVVGYKLRVGLGWEDESTRLHVAVCIWGILTINLDYGSMRVTSQAFICTFAVTKVPGAFRSQKLKIDVDLYLWCQLN